MPACDLRELQGERGVGEYGSCGVTEGVVSPEFSCSGCQNARGVGLPLKSFHP